MQKIINKDKFFIPVLILIILIVYQRWLSFDIFYAGDWPYFYKVPLAYFSVPSVWFNLNGLGSIYLTLWRLPLDVAQGLFGVFGYGSNVSDKILIFWPTLFVANFSIYYLAKKIVHSSIAGFTAAIVFNYNTYYFVANTAFLLYDAAAWSVITFLIFINALEKGKLYLFILSSISLFITGFYDFRIAYITIFILICYFIYFNFFIKKQNFKLTIKSFFYFILQGSIFILLNFYWLISFFSAKSLTSNEVLQRGLFGNEFSNILYSITLFHPFWTGRHSAYFNPQPIFFYFWLIPILAFSGLYLYRKNRNVLFFGILSLVGIFLTKQVGMPFSNVYPWLFAHIPLFNAFREASKFYYLIALGYAILIASFVNWVTLKKDLTSNKLLIWIYSICILLVIAIFLYNAKPIITGQMQDIYTPKRTPSDYVVLRKYLENQNGYFRTFWVPNGTNWSISSANMPIISSYSILGEDWSKLGKPYAIVSKTTGRYIVNFLMGRTTQNLLSESGVRFVIVPVLDKDNNDNVFLSFGEKRSFYISKLDKIKYLHKTNIGTKDLIAYENSTYKPHIYITNNIESIKKNQSYERVFSYQVSPSEYSVKLQNVKSPIFLNFSDTFNAQWKIRAGVFNWFGVLTKKNYFISDKYHFQNDATLNSFKIDPNTICKEFSCQENKDGSYNIDLTLYFLPQSYLYLGLIISGATFLCTIIYLVCAFFKSLYEKRN